MPPKQLNPEQPFNIIVQADDSLQPGRARVSSSEEPTGDMLEFELPLLPDGTLDLKVIGAKVSKNVINAVDEYFGQTQQRNIEAIQGSMRQQIPMYLALQCFIEPKSVDALIARAPSLPIEIYNMNRNVYDTMVKSGHIPPDPRIVNAARFEKTEPSVGSDELEELCKTAVEIHDIATHVMKHGTLPPETAEKGKQFYPELPGRDYGRLRKRHPKTEDLLRSLDLNDQTLEEVRQSALETYHQSEGLLTTLLSVWEFSATYRPANAKTQNYLQRVAQWFEARLLDGPIPESYATEHADKLRTYVEQQAHTMLKRLADNDSRRSLVTEIQANEEWLRTRALLRSRIDANEALWPISMPESPSEDIPVDCEVEDLPLRDVIDDEPVPAEPALTLETDTPTAEELARKQLLDQHTELMNAYTDLLVPFRASSRSIRKNELQPVLRDLILGQEFKDTDVSISPMPDEQAGRIVRTLYGLRHIATANTGILKSELEQLLDMEQGIIDQVLQTRTALKPFQINGFAPAQQELLIDMLWLQKNHNAFSQLLGLRMQEEAAKPYQQLLIDLFSSELEHESLSTINDAVAIDSEVIPEQPVILDEQPDELPDTEPAIIIPLHETDEALQLDWEIFPDNISLAEIKTRTSDTFGEKVSRQIDWRRIHDLIRLKNAVEGSMYRSKPRSLGAEVPYFVVVSNINGKEFAIAENPEYGNASYVLRTELADYGASWKQVFEQSRSFARLLGAERVIHTDSENHLMRIVDKIQELLLVSPKPKA